MIKNYLVILIFGTSLIGYSQKNNTNNEVSTSLYTDVTLTHLPYNDLQLLSMDAGIADLDLDGD